MANQIKEIDKRNPITASRLIKVFSRWKSFNDLNKKSMLDTLLSLSKLTLSSNTSEIVELITSR